MLLYALALLRCLACLFRGAGCAFDSVLLICICILCNPLMLRIFSDTFTLHLQYLQYITVQSFTSENILVLCHNFVNEPRNQNILKGLHIKTSGCCSEATTLRLHELVDLSQSSKRFKDHTVRYGSIWLMAQIKYMEAICVLFAAQMSRALQENSCLLSYLGSFF